ncbi:MAG: hypothetical protein E7649_02380 [Ruminococcaceae bacterium]|nr:hypothetical protein [Oscillospiraceae bacterium]
MPRKPKAKDGLTAGQRAALYEARQAEKIAKMSGAENAVSLKQEQADKVAARSLDGSDPPKAEKVLPKPQHATVRVDFSLDIGEIKPMHGMCNGPVSYGADISELFREIGVPRVRFSGTDTPVSSLAIDISRIFKNPNADPHDPCSYDFACTDRYVSAAYNCGARVMFRLGESFDRAGIKEVTAPQNFDAWCEVCVNVIKHYNDYWADGFAFGIEYFEIWGVDPDSRSDIKDKGYELYRKLSGMIKLYDRNIKVGGMCFDDEDSARDFIRFCRRSHAPLDFITLSLFESTPVVAANRIRSLVPILINLGFNETEIIVGEWAYIAKNVDLSTNNARRLMDTAGQDVKKRAHLFGEQSGIKGAAYALSFMLEAGAISEVGGAHLYDAQPALSPWCPICDPFGAPQKAFYAFKMFGELYRARRAVYCSSEQTEGYAHSGIYASATISASGEACVLISSFEGCGAVDVRLESIPPQLYTAQIYMLDGVKNFEEGQAVQLSGPKKRLVLSLSEYGAVLIKLF